MRKIMAVSLCVGVLFAWQIYQSDIANANNKCSIAGVWKATGTDVESEAIIIFTPLDPTGKKFVVTAETISSFDPTYGGSYFPADTQAGRVFGYAERTAPGNYDVSLYQYGVSIEWGGAVWKTVDRAIVKLIECDHGLSALTLQFFYVYEGNWYPGDCFPATAMWERITFAPACGELPDFPE